MYLDTAQRLYLINIIAGISNRGNVYYTINRGKNNSKTFIAYLVKLIEHLDKENPYWRETTILSLIMLGIIEVALSWIGTEL